MGRADRRDLRDVHVNSTVADGAVVPIGWVEYPRGEPRQTSWLGAHRDDRVL